MPAVACPHSLPAAVTRTPPGLPRNARSGSRRPRGSSIRPRPPEEATRRTPGSHGRCP